MTNAYFSGKTRSAWVPAVIGVLSIAIGIWCLASPVASMVSLAYAFAIWMLVSGVMDMTFAIGNKNSHPGWGWTMALGLLEIVTGIWMLATSVAVMTTTFMFVVGIWLIVVCINAICEIFATASYTRDWIGWMLGFLLATIFFAFIFLSGPIAGGVAVWLYIGISFILFGFYRIVYAVRIRSLNRREI